MLANWEKQFSDAIRQIAPEQRCKAGCLLAVIPDYSIWLKFTESVNSEWSSWRTCLEQYPNCLLTLYGGLAFFEYDDNAFWPHFAKVVGLTSVSTSDQTLINSSFEKVASQLGFTIQKNDRTLFVSTAVYHIGIPVSLWDGFLDICEWASWREDWKDCSETDWVESVNKRSGSKLRLRRFLIENRKTATDFIEEVLDVRKILHSDPNFSLSEIEKATILRPEYFDEVPETAAFLRPANPDSLFNDRPKLVWDERRISLYLPGIEDKYLPATWSLDHLSQKASTSPSELTIDSVAFKRDLLLRLDSAETNQIQRLRGLYPFGIADLSLGGRFLNPDRDEFPLKHYVVVASEKIEFVSEGFENEETSPNEEFLLSDHEKYYVTQLWPTDKRAKLHIKLSDSARRTIHFRTRAKIDAQFFSGQSYKSACFRYIKDKVKLDHLPMLCLAVPVGYFRNNENELNHKFKVLRNRIRCGGQWERRQGQDEGDVEYYFWKWDEHPFLEPKKNVIVTHMGAIKNLFHSPDIKGDNVFSISAGSDFGVEYRTYIDHSKRGLDDSWINLPGAFLPWFLLCQKKEGMTWDDLVFAKDMIAPESDLKYYDMRRYADRGLISQKGQKWFIRESRAVLSVKNNDLFELKYCGDPSLLWSLYRRMANETILPTIEVVVKRGEPAYLSMMWHQDAHHHAEQHLRKQGISIVESLWNP